MTDTQVAVGIPKKKLQELQFLAQVYGTTVGKLIGDAVEKYIDESIASDEFRTKAGKFSEGSEVLTDMLRQGMRMVPATK